MMGSNSAESVFARPASWLTTTPALVAATLAGGSVLVSLFVIPARLPEFYGSSLSEAKAAYAEAVEEGDLNQIRRSAGDLNVIYNRLVLLESGDPARYWQWAEFSRSYADQLRAVLDQKKGNLSDDELNELQSLMNSSHEKALDTFEYLSYTDSEFSERAFLNFIDANVTKGLIDNSIHRLTDELPKLYELTTSDDRKVVIRSVFLYHQIGIETAWGRSSGNRGSTHQLLLDVSWLDKVWHDLDGNSASEPSALHVAYLSLAQCLLPNLVPTVPGRSSADITKSESSGIWEDRFAEVLLGIRDGEWNDVAFLLARNTSENSEAVRLGTARWICRLAVSEKAKEDVRWQGKYASGIQIVMQIAPQIPELSELIWLMARKHANAAETSNAAEVRGQPDTLDAGSESGSLVGTDEQQSELIAQELVDAVVGGQAVAVRHTLLAFSNMLSGKPNVARSHLQLTQRSGGTLMQIAHIALGRLYTMPASHPDATRIADLMDMVTDLEPKSGLNWFVLGIAHQRQGNLLRAEIALAKAEELLPDVDAIGEQLESVRSDLTRQEREKQLRPVE
ncbi:MAG: hypothetical protein Aurels2KO_26990 [Aureliella sp.]